MPNLFFLFKEWRESIMGESYESGKPPFLLSTIAYFAPKIFPPNNDKAYPFKAIKDNVDFVNLVCYDYYGSRDFYVTTEHALLYDLKCRNSTHYGISSWINDIGILEGKLVMGLPLYGRTWKAFINPTFSPSEKLIRGIDYGQPGEVPLYKFKWVGYKVDTIEYILPDTTKERYHVFKHWRDFDNPKAGRFLTSVPKEYHKIESYDWFKGVE